MKIVIQAQKQKKIINESDIQNVFRSMYTTIIANIKKSLGKGSGWIISDCTLKY